jgi:uncharacterized membrane protein YfcA
MENILALLKVYLPIADVTVNLLAIIMIGMITGLLAGMFGLGGGLIIVPILTLLGIDYSVATASCTNQMTASSLSGYLAYARRNRVDYSLGLIMLIGGLVGSATGIKLFYHLTKIGLLDFVVSICFIVILGTIGICTFFDASRLMYYRIRKTEAPKVKKISLFPNIKIPFKFSFASCHEPVSVISLILVGFIGGILVSIMGIGGSLIIIPIMVYLLNISPAFTAGTTHFQIIFTTILSTLLHSYSGHHLDIILSSILMLFTALGAQLGVRLSAGFHPDNFRILLAFLMLGLCAKVLYGVMATPFDVFTIEIITR